MGRNIKININRWDMFIRINVTFNRYENHIKYPFKLKYKKQIYLFN